MKRSKQVSRGKGRESDDLPSFMRPPPERTWDWTADVASQPDTAFAPYALGTHFSKGAFLLHPKFGKGVVTQVEGGRIEVLFEEGPKRLGHAAA